MSSNGNILTSSFSISIHLISFAGLITLASTSSTTLKRSGHSEHPCLIYAFSGIASSFSLYRMSLAVDSYISFIVCSLHSLRLYQEDFLAFLNGPFCIYLGDHVVCMVYCLCATILAF